MVRSCVLPLAGSANNVLWKWRHGGHTELGNLANALGVRVHFHDVERNKFAAKEGPQKSPLNIQLLSTGAHIEPVYEKAISAAKDCT